MRKIKIGLYGTNGHQIQRAIAEHPRSILYAVANVAEDKLPLGQKPRIYGTLVELLSDPEVELVSLCSPRRGDQADDAVRCMLAGKHVYAEKPCAMKEKDLDRIISTAKKTGKIFHEMAGTDLSKPHASLKKIIAEGQIGEVIQVHSQKSYPWGDWRPKDERIDGGLAMQAGIYNCRFVEHVAGIRIKSIQMKETKLGNSFNDSECRRAVSFLMGLENGGLASGVANYCCPNSPSWNKWGYETVSIFGTEGFVESINGGELVRLAVNGREPRIIDATEHADYLDLYLDELLYGKKIIPYNIEDETSPTRWVIRAKTAI